MGKEKGVTMGLTVLGLGGLWMPGVCGEDEKTQREMMVHEKRARGIAPAATSTKKRVVGVLALEARATTADSCMEA